MSKQKETKEAKKLTYTEAIQIKWELEQLDLSYAPKGFNSMPVRLIVQENIVGLQDALRAIEPQQKELTNLVADYNREMMEITTKFNVGTKDHIFSKEDRIAFDEEVSAVREKYKKENEEFKIKNKQLQETQDSTECGFVLKKGIKKDMLPSNITNSDMQIVSRLMEW